MYIDLLPSLTLTTPSADT